MARRSRTLAGIACALALTAPAYAANEEAPGALKKQATTPDVTTPQAPAAAQPNPAPAPQAAPKAQTKSAPVTGGTTKKLQQAQPATGSPTAGSTTATSRRQAATRHQAAAPAPSAVRQPTSTRTRPGKAKAKARGRSHAVPVRAHGRAGAPGQRVAAGAPYTAPGQTPVAHAKAGRAHTPAKAKQAAAKTGDPALASITQAADHVVEVIPGVVILAFAGLVTLVMMLILRSLTVERQRGKALATSYGVTVEALAAAIEAKDLTTGGHIERVRRLGLLLAGEIVPRETRDPQMAYGFLLHDIGKLAVPDAILRAPGRLSEDQWTLMRRHPEEGVRMLAGVPFLGRALDVVRHHHERWDGGGYPDGLRGEEIPLWARIFSVVDALDAITAERPYRAARSYEAALEEIRHHAGTQFDPAVVEALERLDPAVVQPLLEPTQLLEQQPAEVTPLAPLVAA